MNNNLKFSKFKNIDVLSFIISIILYLKFFLFIEHIPLHDEVTAIERFTEWKNFLRKDGVNNHTLISVYGFLVRSFYGFDLSIFRLISFFSFVGIIFLFNRIFNNFFYCLLFMLIIFNSNFLLNAINTYRGYYIYAFLSCLIFYFLIIFDQNHNNSKILIYIFVVSALLVINALYGLFIVFPVLISIFSKIFNKKIFYKNGIIFFGAPVILFYIIFCFLDGLVINNNNNLNFNFIIENFSLIFFENIQTGFINIFNATPELTKDNHYQSYIYTFKRFLNGEDYIYSKENLYILIYFLSFFFLIYNFFRSFLLIDLTILFMFLFYFIVDKDPFIRVHSGKIYYCIFYIFYNFNKLFAIKLLSNSSKYKNLIISIFIIYLTLNQNPDLKWQETRQSVDNIKKNLELNNCQKSNEILSEYEIWIVKNIFPNLCRSRYDFERKKNILF